LKETRRGGKLQAFLAVLRYEFLWNLRKKKTIGLFLIVFTFVTLRLALFPLLDYFSGVTLRPDPSFVFDNVSVLQPTLLLFLLAIATTMNTISGEFESGTIIPLLTKPISKGLVFTGKIVAAFLTLLGAYIFLAVYTTIGGLIIYGPQNNLELVPEGVLGLTAATMVWAAIVIALGTLSKNSMVAALGGFGIYLGTTIVGAILTIYLGATSILFYTPGDGPTATTATCGAVIEGNATSFITGTNGLGSVIMNWILNPALSVNFCGIRFRGNRPETFALSAESISTVALRDIGVGVVYIIALFVVSWLALRRTQITE